MMLVETIVNTLERLAPLETAESYDNTGWQLRLSPLSRCDRVLVCLNFDGNTLQQAIDNKCQLIVCHHPPIFFPFKKLLFPNPLIAAAQAGIQVYATHTNFDKFGTSMELARKLGFPDSLPVPGVEFACYCNLPTSVPLAGVVDSIRKQLKTTTLRVANASRCGYGVSRIAFCAGSGSSLLQEMSDFCVDLYVTSDVKYHETQGYGYPTIVDVSHFASERHVPEMIKNCLKALNVEVVVAKETDVWETR